MLPNYNNENKWLTVSMVNKFNQQMVNWININTKVEIE